MVAKEAVRSGECDINVVNLVNTVVSGGDVTQQLHTGWFHTQPVTWLPLSVGWGNTPQETWFKCFQLLKFYFKIVVLNWEVILDT